MNGPHHKSIILRTHFIRIKAIRYFIKIAWLLRWHKTIKRFHNGRM